MGFCRLMCIDRTCSRCVYHARGRHREPVYPQPSFRIYRNRTLEVEMYQLKQHWSLYISTGWGNVSVKHKCCFYRKVPQYKTLSLTACSQRSASMEPYRSASASRVQQPQSSGLTHSDNLFLLSAPDTKKKCVPRLYIVCLRSL